MGYLLKDASAPDVAAAQQRVRMEGWRHSRLEDEDHRKEMKNRLDSPVFSWKELPRESRSDVGTSPVHSTLDSSMSRYRLPAYNT